MKPASIGLKVKTSDRRIVEISFNKKKILKHNFAIRLLSRGSLIVKKCLPPVAPRIKYFHNGGRAIQFCAVFLHTNAHYIVDLSKELKPDRRQLNPFTSDYPQSTSPRWHFKNCLKRS